MELGKSTINCYRKKTKVKKNKDERKESCRVDSLTGKYIESRKRKWQRVFGRETVSSEKHFKKFT